MPSQYQILLPPTPQSWRSLSALENLHLATQIPKPSPSTLSPKQVLVRIRAAAINARDVMVIAHDPIYPGPHIENLVPCADGAGEVEAVGGDSEWEVGDRVMILGFGWIGGEVPGMVELEGKGAGSVQGTLREYAVLPDEQLIRAPSHLSFDEVASMPCAGGTAANTLVFGPVPLKPGMTVLVQGTGGVSCFLIQLASSAGATVIVTSSSSKKLETAKTLGATHLINYTTHPNWSSEVLRLTNGRGVDHVCENGGAATLSQSLACTRSGGLISIIGFLAGPAAETEKLDNIVASLIYGAKTLRGVFAANKAHQEEVVKRFEKFGLKPAVGRVFEWGEAREAFEYSMGYTGVGKTVIRVV